MFKMLKQIKIPFNVGIAFSGGVDSLAVAHFLKRGKRNITLFHFNHGCEYSDKIQNECEALASALELPIVIHKNDALGAPKGESLENFWRKKRYKFLFSQDIPVITCHHLNDAVETWLFTSFNGNPKVIPYESKNVIRPFLLTPKRAFVNYCERHGLTPAHDPYNEKFHLARNFIRANIVPQVEKINPGIESVIAKKYLEMT